MKKLFKLLLVIGSLIGLVMIASPASARHVTPTATQSAAATGGVLGKSHYCYGQQINFTRFDVCIDLYEDTRSGALQFKTENEFICGTISPTTGNETYGRCAGVTTSYWECMGGWGCTSSTRPVCGVYGGAACDSPRTLSYGTSWFTDDYRQCRWWQGQEGQVTLYYNGVKYQVGSAAGDIVDVDSELGSTLRVTSYVPLWWHRHVQHKLLALAAMVFTERAGQRWRCLRCGKTWQIGRDE